MLILKQNAANTVPTPPSGKGTIFLDDSDVLSVKTSDGNVETFPTVAASNSQVVFIDGTSLSGNNSITYDFNNSILTVTGNIAAGNIKTDNLLYANGTPWDLEQPGGSNTQIQFNDADSFGGSAALTFNKTTNAVSATGNLSAGNLSTSGDLGVSGNAVISGNLTVDGNLVYVNVESIAVEDPIIQLQTGPNGAAPTSNSGKDIGSALNYYDSQARIAFMGWDTSNAEFGLASQASIAGEVVTFSTYGNLRAGVYFGNAAGLTNIPGGNIVGNISGNISNATHASTANTVVDAAQPNITSTGTLTGLSVNGNITAANITANTGVFTGNGSGLSALAGGNVTGTVANATHASSANTVVDAAQPNITSTGTLVSLDVTGGVTAGNVYANSGTVGASLLTGTLTTASQPNITSVGTLSSVTITGNATAGNVYANSGTIGASLLTGTLTTASQPNITSVGTLTSIAITGNATAGNVYANSGTIGASILKGEGGNISNVTAGNITGQVANALVAGTVYTAAQPNITSVGTLSSLAVTGNASAGNISTGGALSVTGNANVGNLGTAQVLASANITAPQFISNVADGTAPLVVTSTTKVANLNADLLDGYSTATAATANTVVIRDANGSFSANIITGTLTGAADTAGTVTTAAQPNITSVGTLSSLAVTGNVSAGNVSATDISGTTLGGTLTTAAQPNITSVGTLSSLAVTGNVSAGNVSATSGAFTNVSGNGSALSSLTGANVTGEVGFAAVANSVAGANVSGQVANALVAGTVYTAAQPNITSVGTLTSLAVTGNASAGNISTGGVLSVTGNANVGNIGATNGVFTSVSGNGSALSSLTGGNVTGQVGNALVSGTVYTAAQPNITSVGTLTGLTLGGNLAMGNFNITGLAEPVNSTDAATKSYVDDVAQGLHTHDSCNAATTGTLATISGGTVTYNNGSSGVGATLTTTGSYTTIDSVTLSDGMRILVKNEANAAHNGIYVRTSSTVLTRASDFDTPVEMAGGDFTFVNGGSLYDNTGWVMTDPVTTVGTTDVNWVQFSGAGTYTAGTGLTLTGTVFSVNASQTQITSVGTLGSLTVTGTATAGNLSTGGTLSVTGNANVGNIGAAAGVFTSVSGNGSALTALNASNISTGTLAQARLANASVTLGSTALTLGSTVTTVAGLSSVTSTTFVGALTGAATTAGTVTTAAQPNITSVGTLSSLSVSGNANVGNIGAAAGVFTTVSGNGSALTALNGSNITTGTIAAARVATLNQNTTGYAATVSSAAQPNITSVGTLTSLSSSGNITAPNLIANTGMFISSVNAAVSAAGTAQANATGLTTQINVVSTVASGAGVRMPTAVAGMRVTIMNTSANALAVYPASGGTINSLSLNAAFSQAAGARLDFVATSATQWYTLNATYA